MSPSECPNCGHALATPPPASAIKAQWPDVKPNKTLDRSVARCYQCELAQAHLDYKMEVHHGGRKIVDAVMWYFAIWGKRDHTNTLTKISRS
ncbi:hypothetical protein MCOR27_006495 [Pyricularia oryzae]|uniref:Uncharacterized protein n=5 Tax=Pyricularia TaxID=48558 RepID=A0ABQ8NXM2_PYRGI|nr:uncharacterized protein MGG_17356 [Pyricularia oryzae 70-15]ELQ43833.1 hypothetical protein OOU_Y34scaffold00126g36 [Pyricularia oryzae Y34]KAH8840507.1 hypothetical protein MCOR01_007215 [Pyricularia oryzae]KAI6302629.1 hypothetical protein MCOR33_002053 [Pyricularia grisea]EHA48531.1 hypothetical protein MGG_17356 [Pyricularia oryzae 70-15]KAH9434196.1 hypothetical protein MCOR02_006215 [Pyricularia oryzae]